MVRTSTTYYLESELISPNGILIFHELPFELVAIRPGDEKFKVLLAQTSTNGIPYKGSEIETDELTQFIEQALVTNAGHKLDERKEYSEIQ